MHLYCMENTISQIAIRGRTVPRSRPANAGHPHGGTSIRAVVGCSSPLHIVPMGDGNDVVGGDVEGFDAAVLVERGHELAVGRERLPRSPDRPAHPDGVALEVAGDRANGRARDADIGFGDEVDVVGRVRQRLHGRPYDLGVDPEAPDPDLLAPVDGVSSFRGGASGLKKRGVSTLSRKRDASRPERKPTRVFATTMLHHTLLTTSVVRPQVARSTGRSSPALNGGFADPEGRPVGGAHGAAATRRVATGSRFTPPCIRQRTRPRRVRVPSWR